MSNGSNPSQVSCLLWKSHSGIRFALMVMSSVSLHSFTLMLIKAAVSALDSKGTLNIRRNNICGVRRRFLRPGWRCERRRMSEGRIRTQGNHFCTWNRHLRRPAGCVGFWVMITHRNARHVRRRLAECCDFLPGSWTVPKTAGLQTGLKRTKHDSGTENSPNT